VARILIRKSNMQRLHVLALALVLSSCVLEPDPQSAATGSTQDELQVANDRAADEVALANLPAEASTDVCQDIGQRWHCRAKFVPARGGGRFRSYAGAGGVGAADLASAYKLNTSASPGKTIAIVDAYGYSAAESDLAQYRSQMGLPACSKANGCLKIVNQSGQTSPLPGPPPAGNDWTVETALDLDMASAGCPNCKLLLIQADDDQGNGLFIAQNTAAQMGAAVVSDSWGGPDDGSSASEEAYFNHPGVGYFVATGDNGYNQQPDYPSTSAYVTGVGGTSLQQSGSSRGWAEAAWSSGGSSCSATIPKPSYQTNSACSFRAAADVAAVGDPNTGPAIYNGANGGMIIVGGTSASTPFVAGVYALTGHGADGPSLSYKNPTMFFDVTSGSNGTCTKPLCTAGTGWDGPTGNGTPNGTMLAAGGTTTDNPPNVTFTSPSNGATLQPGFSVSVSASDDHGVTKVELRVDGGSPATVTAAPYSFTTSASLGNGSHTLEARAYDTAGQTSNATISVTVDDGSGSGSGSGSGTGSGSGSGSGSGHGSGSGSGSGDGETGWVSNGCSAGGGAGGGAVILLGIALAVRRRRR
jgi:MYXO-CTERM domain-containing protein